LQVQFDARKHGTLAPSVVFAPTPGLLATSARCGAAFHRDDAHAGITWQVKRIASALHTAWLNSGPAPVCVARHREAERKRVLHRIRPAPSKPSPATRPPSRGASRGCPPPHKTGGEHASTADSLGKMGRTCVKCARLRPKRPAGPSLVWLDGCCPRMISGLLNPERKAVGATQIRSTSRRRAEPMCSARARPRA
jgi:hypothetical protein